MTSVDRSARATSFGAIADDYDRFRPGPPPEAVEWVLAGPRDVAVEIGAGTGALTRELFQRAGRVTAVEPDHRMGAVLAARVPHGTVVAGQAEELPLRAAIADALLGASMWHWVDEPRAAREAARVLRPGGVLGLLWSGPDRSSGWPAELLARPRREGEASGASGAIADPPPVDRPRRRRHEVHLPEDAPFTAAETRTMPWSLTVTPAQLVGLTATYSGFIVLPEAEKARRLEELAAVVRDHPRLAGRDEIELPMRCMCWRAFRA
jgi:SAM-dependent methyltransferase